MKVNLIALIMIVWTLNASAQSSNNSGIEFFHGTWVEALAQAKAQDKPLFVDIWATWCGPCKRLAAEVFPQPEVGAFFNKHFVCYKLMTDPKDADEKKLARELSDKYHVRALPTLLWVDGDGQLLHFSSGYRPAEELLAEGQRALDPEKRTGALIEKWESGDRSLATGLKYFEVFSDKVEEFDDFFRALSDTEKCDSNLLTLMWWGVRLPAKSATSDYIASRWKELYSSLPDAESWESFLTHQLDDRLKAAANEEAYKTVCDRWRGYGLPFTEWAIDKFECVRYFQEKDYANGYRRAEEMMKRYSGKDLFFIIPVLYALFDQLCEGELPTEQRLPILEKWTERYVKEGNAYNANEMKTLSCVVSGNEAKARKYAAAAKAAQPDDAQGADMKSYIDYLLSPLEKQK